MRRPPTGCSTWPRDLRQVAEDTVENEIRRSESGARVPQVGTHFVLVSWISQFSWTTRESSMSLISHGGLNTTLERDGEGHSLKDRLSWPV